MLTSFILTHIYFHHLRSVNAAFFCFSCCFYLYITQFLVWVKEVKRQQVNHLSVAAKQVDKHLSREISGCFSLPNIQTQKAAP